MTRSTRSIYASAVFLFSVLIFAGDASAGPAPKQLYNKSIIVNWVESVIQKAPDGSTRNPQINTVRTAYVSSAGRLFVKGTRNISNRNFQGGNQTERGPDNASSGSGGFTFESDRLVGTAIFDGGARRMTVSFDPGFSSCTASVVYGKSGSANQKWKGFDGVTYELISVSVGSIGCSVRDGNALAN